MDEQRIEDRREESREPVSLAEQVELAAYVREVQAGYDTYIARWAEAAAAEWLEENPGCDGTEGYVEPTDEMLCRIR